MSNNDKLNESIRAKLSERCEEYGCLYEADVSDDGTEQYCWPEWNTQIIAGCGKSLVLLREWINSCAFTPTELRYIHENLSSEAWDKLGLELPIAKYRKDVVLSPAQIERAKSMIPLYAERKLACNSVSCEECPLGVLAFKGQSLCGCRVDYPERIQILRKVLDAQLPPLEYDVPVLNAEEREHVGAVLQGPENNCSCSESWCGQDQTRERCMSIMDKIFCHARPKGYTDCPLLADAYKHARKQVIDALQDVLDKQESLLPPHNVVKFEREVSDGWVKWLACEKPEDTCPRANDDPRGNNLCKKQCGAVFPDLEPGLRGRKGLYCPCHQYSPEITRVVIEKCVALGVKFEFKEYHIWTRPGGERLRVIDQSKAYMLCHTASGAVRNVAIDDTHRYTKTPPKEEFKPYLAVVLNINGASVVRGQIIEIVEVVDGGADGDYLRDSNRWHFEYEHILPITNPDELHDMLHEMSGEKGMVEEIKAEITRLFYIPFQTSEALKVMNKISKFITNLERNGKCGSKKS